MGNPLTVPMISQDGSVADIPHDKVGDAKNGGYKLAVDMTAPDGKTATIPYENVSDAMSQGNYKLPGANTALEESDAKIARGDRTLTNPLGVKGGTVMDRAPEFFKGAWNFSAGTIEKLAKEAGADVKQTTGALTGNAEDKAAVEKQAQLDEGHKMETYHNSIAKFHEGVADKDVTKVLESGWELRKLFEKPAGDQSHDVLKTITDSALRGAEGTYQKAGEHATATVAALQKAVQQAQHGDIPGAHETMKAAAGEASQTFGYGLATGVPLVGPAAAQAGEDTATRPAQGLGEGASLIFGSEAKNLPVRDIVGGVGDLVKAGSEAVKKSSLAEYLPKPATASIGDAYAGVRDAVKSAVSGGVSTAAEAAGKATGRAVATGAESLGKNVVVPAFVGLLKGTGAALFDMAKEQSTNLVGNVTDAAMSAGGVTKDAVVAAIDQLGPKFDVLKDQAGGIASDIQTKLSDLKSQAGDVAWKATGKGIEAGEDVASALSPERIKSVVEETIYEHHELVNDLILRNAGRIAGLGKDIINKVVDEYHLRTNPSVSGGSGVPPDFMKALEHKEAPWSDQLPADEESPKGIPTEEKPANPVATAADANPRIKELVTAGQMDRSTFQKTTENFLKESPPAGKTLAEKLYEPQSAGFKQIASEVVDRLKEAEKQLVKTNPDALKGVFGGQMSQMLEKYQYNAKGWQIIQDQLDSKGGRAALDSTEAGKDLLRTVDAAAYLEKNYWNKASTRGFFGKLTPIGAAVGFGLSELMGLGHVGSAVIGLVGGEVAQLTEAHLARVLSTAAGADEIINFSKIVSDIKGKVTAAQNSKMNESAKKIYDLHNQITSMKMQDPDQAELSIKNLKAKFPDATQAEIDAEVANAKKAGYTVRP